MLALAMHALCILLVRSRHAYHAASLAVPPEIRRKHAQHSLRIKTICLGPTRAAVNKDTGRIEYVAVNAVCRQQPVQPKTVTSCLKAAGYRDFRLERDCDPGTQRRHQCE